MENVWSLSSFQIEYDDKINLNLVLNNGRFWYGNYNVSELVSKRSK